MYQTLLLAKKKSVLTVTLNRPDVRNAFNDVLISELHRVFIRDALSPDVRVVILKGAGSVFCAGGDLNWMKKSASLTVKQNKDDAAHLFEMLTAINNCPKPVIGVVHGAAMGGGLGLIAVCDHVLAVQGTKFSFSEVKLGLIPATIGPFVLAKIGETWARSYFLTGNLFEDDVALKMGLIHQTSISTADLENDTEKLIKELLRNSPQAVATAKKFIAQVQPLPMKEKGKLAAKTLADLRTSDEGQEGIKAFLEKRKPNWI